MKDLYHGHDLAPPRQTAPLGCQCSQDQRANGLEALAASIAEHGLLQPLIVSPSAGKKTLYDVHAGGRRWRAIGLLIERGTLPKDYAVDVRLCENEAAAAREISLAENLLREAMTRRMRRRPIVRSSPRVPASKTWPAALA
jgi:ParB/RepB/Spo0J family partition protein